MADDDLTFDPVRELVAACKLHGLKLATDPAKVNPPGAWLVLDEIHPATLQGGWQLRTQVVLIAPDVDQWRAADLLADLFNKLTKAATPDGPTRPQGVILPDNPSPLPALWVPVFLYTDPDD